MTKLGLWLGCAAFGLLDLWFRLIHIMFSAVLYLLVGLAEVLQWLADFIDGGFLQWVRLRGSSAQQWSEYMRDRANGDDNG